MFIQPLSTGTIDTLTYATGIGIRPRACVSMYVNCSGFKMDAISGECERRLE